MGRRTVLAVATAVVVAAGMIPALAATGTLPTSGSLDDAVERTRTAETTTEERERPAVKERERVRPAERPTAERERPPAERPEELRLGCRGAEDHIACRWSPSSHPDFAAYLLWRKAGEEPREIVFRTDDRDQTAYRDGDVRPGTVYLYGLAAVDGDGNVVGRSGPARAQLGHERPERPEELRLGCRGHEHDGGPAITCQWSPSRHPDFAAYELWRGDREGREVIFRTDDRAHTRHMDTGVEPHTAYVYVVRVLDADGNVIGSGGPARAQAPGDPALRPGPAAVSDDERSR